MDTKSEIRKTIKILVKELGFIILILELTISIVSVSVLAAVTNNSTENNSKRNINTVISKKEPVYDTNTDRMKQQLVKKSMSTMQLMITEKEVAKGDRAEKIQRKLELERKRKIKELKRKKLKKLMKKQEKEAKRKQEEQWLQSLNTPKNVEILAHLMEGEAGDQSDECQQAVGQVVLNRVRSNNFKQTTIKDVVFAPGQYACIDDGNYDKKPSKQAYKNAKAILTGNVCIKVPKNVVYQAQFKQGSGIWKQIGTETFCYE